MTALSFYSVPLHTRVTLNASLEVPLVITADECQVEVWEEVVDRLDIEQGDRLGQLPNGGQGYELPGDGACLVGTAHRVVIGACPSTAQHSIGNHQPVECASIISVQNLLSSKFFRSLIFK